MKNLSLLLMMSGIMPLVSTQTRDRHKYLLVDDEPYIPTKYDLEAIEKNRLRQERRKAKRNK